MKFGDIAVEIMTVSTYFCLNEVLLVLSRRGVLRMSIAQAISVVNLLVFVAVDVSAILREPSAAVVSSALFINISAFFLLTYGFHLRVSGHVQAVRAAYSEALKLTLLTIAPLCAGLIFYGILLGIGIKAQLHPLALAGLALVGISLGIFVNYVTGPALVAVAYRARRLTDPLLLTRLEVLRRRSGVAVAEYLLVNSLTQRPNAFVTGLIPGTRTVFLNEAIIRCMSQDALIGVMAHEFAHVKCRHLEKNIGVSIVAAALVIICNIALHSITAVAALLTGFVPNFLVLILLVIIVHAAVVLPTSRRHEIEADRLAEHWEAHAFSEALSAMEKQSRTGTKNWTSFFMTHPTLEMRLRNLGERPDAG